MGLTQATSAEVERAAGPSPRAWGSQLSALSQVRVDRSIPTCVGLTGPLVCRAQRPAGPSPRAWGSLVLVTRLLPHLRSIPTCVGLTDKELAAVFGWQVHPHVRGAHRGRCCSQPGHHGPSPRAWGSQKLTCRFTRRYLLVIKGVGSFITQDTLDRFPEI
ncbi:hypothetical protein Tfu_2939 [Thermobifida fusca YX]|nr:hypothetical protein Tfu_2939 [Thermobifida fusca YX]